MTIIANAFYVSGQISNMTLHANTLDASGYCNISVSDNLKVAGSIFTTQRMDVGSTIYATFRLGSNMPFNSSNEVTGTSNMFTMDWASTDMAGMSDIPLTIPSYKIYNQATGEITVPVSGLYHLEIQGVFQNANASATNGVYYKFTNLPCPNARMSAKMTSRNIVSTSHSAFLLAGDRFMPTFYSDDPGATLVPTNGETYIRFVVAATVTPSHSNYVRL